MEGLTVQNSLIRWTGRLIWILVVLAAIVVPSWVQALPPPSHLADQVAPNAGDPLFITWALGWESHALAHHPGQLFAGNIFYPRTDSIAWSENMLAAVPIFAFVRWLCGGKVILAYNIVTLCGYSAVGLAVYGLSKRLLRNGQAALISASLCSFSAARSFALGHTQLAGFCFVPLAILATIGFLDTRRWRYSIGMGLAVGATWLVAAYYTVLVVLVLFAFLLVWLVQSRMRAGDRFLPGMGLAAAFAVLLIGPTLPPYIRLQRAHLFQRSVLEQVAPKWSDLAWRPPSLAYRWLSDNDPSGAYSHSGLYPGLVLSLLALIGVASWTWGRRSRMGRHWLTADSAARHTRGASMGYLWPVAAGIVPAVALTIGPNARNGLSAPFDLLRRTVPGVASLRELNRFWLFVVLCGALAAGYGAKIILIAAGRRRGVALTASILVVIWFELLFRPPMATVDLSARSTVANRALAATPPGAVLELPEPLGVLYPYVTTLRMVRSLDDYHPRVDGYSGALPQQVIQWEFLASKVAPAALVPYLRSYGVRYILLHRAPKACVSGYSDAELTAVVTSIRGEEGVESVLPDGDGLLVTLASGRVDRASLPQVAPGPQRSLSCV